MESVSFHFPKHQKLSIEDLLKTRGMFRIRPRIRQIQRDVQKRIQLHIELAKGEEEYTLGKIRRAIKNESDRRWANQKLIELEKELAWEEYEMKKRF